MKQMIRQPTFRSQYPTGRRRFAQGAIDRRERWRIQFLIALTLLAFLVLVHFKAHGVDLELPPPPVIEEWAEWPLESETPGIDLARLEAAVGPDWSDALPGDQVREMLDAVGRESSHAQTLEALLIEQLREALPGGGEGYLFEKAVLPNDLKLSAAQWEARFDFRLPRAGLGAVPYTARILDRQGNLLKRFNGSAWIDRRAWGIQVTRMVRRGEVIREGDARRIEARLSQLPRGALDRIELAQGTIARRELRPGAWLTEQQVETPDVIRRGQPVTIRLIRGPMIISAPGLTLQAGQRDEIIRVENTASDRVIFARVISSDEVQVII